ncbi:MAG TPA: preprotein translocase subunit SecE [Dehalococcoidia bacterium]|nr:preprotein translocase subunit SecE [Dehalococcoidia bacterium]
MGNRALRRQQAKTKERTAGKSGGSSSVIPRGAPKTQQARRASGGGGGGFLRPRFVTDIWSELRKVVWPEREDVMHLTVVIVIVTLIIGAVLGAIDFGFGWLIDQTLLN